MGQGNIVIRASVVVPTRDRAGLLEGCLRGLADQVTTGYEFEVVVVDNASCDATAVCVERFRPALSNLHYVFEPTPGASRARNAGVSKACGEIVAFIDDDAVPDRGWIDALVGGYCRRPEVAAVCGPTRLLFAQPRPAWLHTDLETWFSALDLGTVPRLLEPNECPWSVNASVRREIAVAVGGFPTDIGPGSRGGYNEDVDFFERVRRTGPIAYEPAARVGHHVDPERASLRWLLLRVFAQGQSNAHREYVRDPSLQRNDALDAARGALWRCGTRGWRRLARGLLISHEPRKAIVDDLVRRSQQLGYAWESLRHASWPEVEAGHRARGRR